jgi:hypothetical protein
MQGTRTEGIQGVEEKRGNRVRLMTMRIAGDGALEDPSASLCSLRMTEGRERRTESVER